MKHLRLAPALILLAVFACSDLPEERKSDVVAPPAPAQSVAEAAPVATGSTLCEAFQGQLQAVRASLEVYPGDAQLKSREETLAAITGDVCG